MAEALRDAGSLSVTTEQPLRASSSASMATRSFGTSPVEREADAALSRTAVGDAISVIEAWSGLDWSAAVEALDHMRHDSPPTPPISLMRRDLLDTTPLAAS
jgi:hypothetical protein